MSDTGQHIFVPFVQRKIHHELKPGDFVRVSGKFYIVDEIRRFRRPFDYTATTTDELLQLTGSMPQRFQHIDKFAVDPVAAAAGVRVTLVFKGVDVTGQQYGHVWTTLNANVNSPDELDVNSLSREDVMTATITYAAGETGDVSIWFSGEEYTLVEFPSRGGPGEDGIPARFVIVHPYGFSRVVTKEEFVSAEMSGRLRT